MKVGVPCMKCSLNPSQTVNAKTGKKSKTCAIDMAWKEMNDERIGRDLDIDENRTYLNVWMEGSTEDDVAQIVQNKIDEINQIRKENGKRSLRKDAVSVVEIIEKPNIEYMSDLPYEEKVGFLNTSHNVMKELLNDWNPNWTILESVQHHDEFGGLSAHNHTLIMLTTVDDNGLPGMNAFKEVNLKFYSFINKNYSKMMREYGYDVEDVRTYDMLTEEEKMERKLNPKEHGVDSFTYKKRKKEEMTQQLDELKVKQEQMHKELEKTVLEITQAPDLDSYHKIQDENIQLKEEISLKDRIIYKLEHEKEELKENLEKWKTRCMDIANKIGNRILTAICLNKDLKTDHEFPDKDVLNEINNVKRNVSYNSNDFRVIPDPDNNGKYCVILLKGDKYDVIEEKLKSRRDGELIIRDIVELKREIKPIEKSIRMIH